MLMNDESYYRKAAYWYSRGRMDALICAGWHADWNHADRYVHYFIGIVREVEDGDRNDIPSLRDAWDEYAALLHRESTR